MPSLTNLPFQKQLAEIERWPADKLRGQQFHQLGLLVEHTLRTVPFYRSRLAAADISGAQRIHRQWHRLPPLTRRDVQSAGNLLQSADIPEAHGAVLSNTTSGSTGVPVTVLGTELDARGASLEAGLIDLFGEIIPPGGHLMIDYDSGGQDETLAELIRRVPPAATYLGSRADSPTEPLFSDSVPVAASAPTARLSEYKPQQFGRADTDLRR